MHSINGTGQRHRPCQQVSYKHTCCTCTCACTCTCVYVEEAVNLYFQLAHVGRGLLYMWGGVYYTCGEGSIIHVGRGLLYM